MSEAIVFSWGVAASAAQVFLLREYLAASGGNELVIGFFMGAWLFGIATGAMLLKGLREESARLAGAVLTASLGPAVILAVTASRLARFLFGCGAGMRLDMGQCALLALLSSTLPAALIGALFPVSTAMLSRPAVKNPAGSAYWIEGAGMAAGSLLATFILIPHLSPAAAMLAALAVPALILAVSGGAPRLSRIISAAGFAGTAAAIIAGGTAAFEEASESARFESLKSGTFRTASASTRYARYDLGSADGEHSLFTDGQFTASFPDEYSDAPRAHLFMAEAGAAKRVLLIGPASFGLIAHILEHSPERIDYVQMDGELLPFLERAAGAGIVPADSRVSRIVADGRAFVRGARPGFYDLIISDMPEPSTIASNRFFTMEYFKDAERALSAGGVFVTGVPSSATWLGSSTTAQAGRIFSALKGAFPSVVPTGGEKAWLVAGKDGSQVTSDWRVLSDRMRRAGGGCRTQPPESLAAFFPDGRSEELSGILLTAGKQRPNSDDRPAAYFYNLARWQSTTGGPGSVLEKIAGIGGLQLALIILAVFLSVSAAFRLAGTASFGASAALLSAGLFGISAQIICLMSFQNAVGALYSQVGTLIAAYMAGMAAGSLAGTWNSRHGPAGGVPIPSLVCGIAALCLAAATWFLPGLNPAMATFALVLMTALSGGVAGVVFPRAASAIGGGTTSAGSRADAVDCAGAVIGAVASSAILIPLTGTAGAAVIIAVPCFFSGILNALKAGVSSPKSTP
jgi:spermidine synthase